MLPIEPMKRVSLINEMKSLQPPASQPSSYSLPTIIRETQPERLQQEHIIISFVQHLGTQEFLHSCLNLHFLINHSKCLSNACTADKMRSSGQTIPAGHDTYRVAALNMSADMLPQGFSLLGPYTSPVPPFLHEATACVAALAWSILFN